MQLYEKYRPQKLSDIIGQDKAVALVRRLIARKDFDRDAFWIEGDTGTGKTSLARCIAAELSCPPDSWSYTELDGERCTIDEVRDLQDKAAASSGLFDQWRVVVVNESHAMTARAVQAWLTFLERLPRKYLIIFTSNQDSADLFGEFNNAFMGRVKWIQLTKVGLSESFAVALNRIARAEKLDGKPMPAYVRFVKENRCDLRTCLQKLELGAMRPGNSLTAAQNAAVMKLVRLRKRSSQFHKKTI